MDKITFVSVELSKRNVSTNEKITIKVLPMTVTEDPTNERLSFVLGSGKIKT